MSQSSENEHEMQLHVDDCEGYAESPTHPNGRVATSQRPSSIPRTRIHESQSIAHETPIPIPIPILTSESASRGAQVESTNSDSHHVQLPNTITAPTTFGAYVHADRGHGVSATTQCTHSSADRESATQSGGHKHEYDCCVAPRMPRIYDEDMLVEPKSNAMGTEMFDIFSDDDAPIDDLDERLNIAYYDEAIDSLEQNILSRDAPTLPRTPYTQTQT